ncbi:hypothetical protein BGX27_000018 [Mortierella sp. AM989]|nr:hypothetical protein BGX27_000018 [Mortierella sp. AM989]
MNTTAANTSAPTNGDPAVASSHEVGMMFVHEYYTFLNKEPSRLHCFYNKKSTMSHGFQGDESEVIHGQQASLEILSSIHAKILDLDFEDCKVLVSNVDSQSSMNGGIMIQVLGEMSNKGGPSQKFVQTFFLAEQPKGYYVLNDIFRYLKDDNDIEFEATVEEPEMESVTEGLIDVVAEESIVVEEATPVPEVVPSTETVTPTEDVKTEVVEEKKPVVEEKRSVEKKAESKKHDKKSEKKDTKKDEAKEAKEAKKEAKKEGDSAEKPKTQESSKKQAPAAAAPTAAPVAETPQEDTPAPAPVAAPVAAPAAPASAAPAAAPIAAPAPVPAEPPKPKTWANLAAKNSNQWGSHANSAVKATSINVAQPSPKPQSPQPSAAQTQNKPQGQKPSGRDDVHGIYVKNITEKMTMEQLREAFSKFGPVKNLEFISKKGCAHVDFETIDAMQAALKQNKVNVGSEVVLAEERRRSGFQSGGRPFHYQNGGGPNGHQGPQGGHRGSRSSRGGGYQDRKSIQRPEKAAATVAVN